MRNNSAGEQLGFSRGEMVRKAAGEISRFREALKPPEKQLTATLKERNELILALDEHALVTIADPQGKITYANDKFCATSKYSREELMGQDHRIINSSFHPKEFIRDLWTTIAHGKVWKGEFKNKAKDGSFYWVDSTIVPFLDERGKPRQYVAICTVITQRKQAEEALSASEISYRRLFEAARDGILILDVDTGRICDVNPFLVALLGFSHNEMVGKTVGELSPFKDIDSNKVMLERLQKDGYVRYENLPLETRDGRHIAVEFVSNVYQAGHKKVIQCNIRNITERKRAEIALIRLAAIIESSDDAIIGKNLNSIITSWNKGAEKIFGYMASEMIGTSITRLIPADRQEEENQILGRIKRGESVKRLETLRKTKGGRLIDVSITASPIKDDTGEIVGVSKVARNITERKQTEQTLRASERSYRRLFEAAKDGILILEADTGRINDVNPFLVELLGFSHGEMVGKAIWEISPFKDIVSNKAKFVQLQQQGYVRYEDLPLETRDGRHIAVEFVSNVYQAGDHNVIQCNIRDITKRKAAEALMSGVQAQLEQTNRDLMKRSEEIQYFYHTLSHELKTPLTAAREFVSIVIDGLAGELNPTQLNYLRIAKKSCTELAVYINDLLDATRLDTGKLHIELKAGSLAAIIDRAIAIMEPVAAGKKIRLSAELHPDLVDVMVDESRIMQILTNLLNNALKFTFEGGEIIVKLGEDPKDSEYFQISVSDSGCGIPKDQIDNLFHRFYQIKKGDATPEKGVGLGLYLCREMVLLHGGRIWVESALGKGSTFSFTIPKRAATKGAHVLVVDDDGEVREALRRLLKDNGFDVVTVAGGSDALQRIGQKTPDVVVLDLMMMGLDGPDTLKEIRKNLGPIPVIVHTGYPDGDLMQRALESSPFTLLAKPCLPKRFVETVRRICQDNQPLASYRQRSAGKTVSRTSARHQTSNSDQTVTSREKDNKEVAVETKASNGSDHPASIPTAQRKNQ